MRRHTRYSVIVILGWGVGAAPAQFGRPAVTPPRPVVMPPRTTVMPPRTTVMPPHIVSPLPHAPNSKDFQAQQAWHAKQAADARSAMNRNQATFAACIVGLIGAPTGAGPLLTASTLAPRSAPPPPPAVAEVPHRADAPFIDGGPAPQQAVRPVAGQVAPVAEAGMPMALWVFGGLGLFAALGFVIIVAVRRTVASAGPRCRICIVATPPGEAPETIRQAWVGLELPVAAGETGARRQDSYGVLSTAGQGTYRGYAVDGATAVSLLAEKDRTAAQWWYENALHVVGPGYQLIFPAEVCEEVSGRTIEDRGV